MANTIINTPELLNLDSTAGATVLAKGTISERPPIPTFSVDYLVVAGGGGGGTGITASTVGTGGGGGAGGLRTSYGSTSGGGSAAESSLSLLAATNYTVTVGSGGNGGVSASSIPTNGQNSVFSSIISVGGGAGASYRNPTNSIYYAQAGGSGGGAAYTGGLQPGGAGTANQGYAGGDDIGNSGAPAYGHPGGGGAAAVGVNGGGSGSGAGGAGLAVSITGSSVTYAGGGGGGGISPYPAGAGGAGGGGAGGLGNGNAGIAGTANTGGGGGGGGKTYASGTLPGNGGNGGSGIVILRYPNTQTITIGSGLTGSTVSDGAYKVTTFTAGTGTISFSGTVVNDNNAIDGTLRFNTDTNKTEYFDGTGWYEIVDEYASGFIGPATNYFDTKLYTGNGAVQSIGGYINGAASFNGSSSNIDTNLNTQNVGSHSFWFKTDSNAVGSQDAIITSTYSSNDKGVAIALKTDGKLRFQISDGNGAPNALDISTSSSYTDGNWHHIVATWDLTSSGTNSYLYIDNNSEVVSGSALTSGWTSGDSTYNIFIGSYYNNTQNFNGDIDQVRIYNVALSASDVAALNLETASTATTATFPSGQTAVATYTMDTSANGLLNTQNLSTVNYPAGAGCIALYEMNGNANDTSGTYNGTPTNIAYQGGAFDQAGVFNGTDSALDTNYTVSGTADFSCSLWVNLQDDGTRVSLISLYTGFGASSTILYAPLSTASKPNEWYFSSKNTDVFYGPSIKFGQWQHVVLTYEHSSTTFTIYVDNVSIGTSVASSATGQDLIIGAANASGATSAKGLIDQVRIFNTALTQSQVTTLARGITTSYSGTNTDVNFNGHLDFAPDFVWVKARDAAHDHVLVNSVNGAGSNQGLSSNAAYYNGQYTATYGYISSLNSNGFTVSSGSSYANYTNVNNEDYVSWNWKAGGAAVAGTGSGVTNVLISANRDAGFSIVKYTGGNSASDTVNHGLTDAEMIILKDLSDGTHNWRVWHKDLTANNWLYLNLSNAQASAATDGGIKNVDSNSFGFINGTTQGVQAVNNSSNNYIAYVWKSISGYSKIGTYEGLGTSTVTVSDVGFKPSFIMIKNIDATANWNMYDLKRSTVADRANKILYPNLSNSEPSATNYYFDMNSSGFVVSATNHEQINFAGRTYIYMAFA